MKRQLLKFSTLAIVLLLVLNANAQWVQKSVSVEKTVQAPVIDGIIDNVWAAVEAQAIDQVWKPGDANEESVSFGDEGATFKALWDDENIYILVEVDDDNHYNHMDAGRNAWEADRVELYFDVNEEIIDGYGPSYGGTGHYQVPGDFATSDFLPFDMEANFIVNLDGSYAFEFAVPINSLLDDTGDPLNPLTRTSIGFDITIGDLDEPSTGSGNEDGLGRINWCNDVLSKASPEADADESWNSLDQAGEFVFSPYNSNQEEPVADAGLDQQVNEGQQVNLDGSASFDNQDVSINVYEWTAPAFITLNDADKALANFIAPDIKKDTVFDIVLTVYDVALNTDKDTVRVAVSRINNAPVADAGDDETYNPGDLVILDGSGSSDEDDDELVYRWESLNELTLQANNTASIQFMAPEVDEPTSYQFRLLVSDGEAASAFDTVAIMVEKASLLSEKASAEKLRIHPNPASDIATLYVGAIANPTVQVITIDGRLVEEIKLGKSGVEQIRLDVANYQTGTYIVVVTGSDKVYTSQLLVK